jgi:hypothetical protein
VRFDFSAQFLKVRLPDKSFGEAWEGLCYALLACQLGTSDLMRLGPPDRGIDILHRSSGDAFQCKALEAGAAGNLPHPSSIESLANALKHRDGIRWNRYVFATNANYTGSGYESICKFARAAGLDDKMHLGFLGPAHWEDLCTKHYDHIRDRMDYRVSVEEKEVLEALRKERYFPQYITAYQQKIQQAGYRIVVTNNRTPVELEFPFSPDLTVENCLDVAKNLLGISLEWTSFADLNSSAGPSVSLTIDGYAQTFSQKLSDIGLKSGDKIQLWIKIVWREGIKEDATPSTSSVYDAVRCELRFHRADYALRLPADWADLLRDSTLGMHRNVGESTVARKEALIQGMIWSSLERLEASRQNTEA